MTQQTNTLPIGTYIRRAVLVTLLSGAALVLGMAPAAAQTTEHAAVSAHQTLQP